MSKSEEHDLFQGIQNAKGLLNALSEIVDEDDAETLRDMIEGETELHEAIETCFNSMQTDLELVTGIKARIDDLSARKTRFEQAAGRKRALIEQAFVIGQLEKMPLAEATLSLRKVPPGLDIEDESVIPAKYWKAQDPRLDRAELLKAVKEAAKEGESIPGVKLGEAGVSLTVRKK